MIVGLAQTKIVWENREENWDLVRHFLTVAKKEQIDLLLFPEMSLTGFTMSPERFGETDEDLVTLRHAAKLAKTYDLAIGIGYIRKNSELREDRYENRYAILSRQGEVCCDYAKIHPFTYGQESRHYTGGNRIVSTDLEGIRITPFICYDLRFPEIFQKAASDSDLITVAANWPAARSEQWRALLVARAIETQCYIAGVNRVGEGDGLFYSGDSLLVSPKGEILADGRLTGEGIVKAAIDLDALKQYRESFPVRKDRKCSLYRTFYEG